MPCPNCGSVKIEVMDIGIVHWKQCSSCLFEFDFDGVESPESDDDDSSGGQDEDSDRPLKL